MIIIVEFQLYARKVIVLAVSRKWCVFHVNDMWTEGVKTGFSCGRHKWMTSCGFSLLGWKCCWLAFSSSFALLVIIYVSKHNSNSLNRYIRRKPLSRSGSSGGSEGSADPPGPIWW